jgi:hypothetical protein
MKLLNCNLLACPRAFTLRETMSKSRLRILLPVLTSILLSSLFFGALGDPAQSQTTVGFKQEDLNVRLKPPGFVTDKKCDQNTGELKALSQGVSAPGVQTAGATVFLSNSSDAPLNGLRFSGKLQSKRVGLSALFKPGFYRFYDPDAVPVDIWVCP